jgi:hypothetical protein
VNLLLTMLEEASCSECGRKCQRKDLYDGVCAQCSLRLDDNAWEDDEDVDLG